MVCRLGAGHLCGPIGNAKRFHFSPSLPFFPSSLSGRILVLFSWVYKSYLTENINLLFEKFFSCLYYLFPLSSFFLLLVYLFCSLSLQLESPQRSGEPWMLVQILKWITAKLMGNCGSGQVLSVLGLIVRWRRPSARSWVWVWVWSSNVGTCRYFLCSNFVSLEQKPLICCLGRMSLAVGAIAQGTEAFHSSVRRLSPVLTLPSSYLGEFLPKWSTYGSGICRIRSLSSKFPGVDFSAKNLEIK